MFDINELIKKLEKRRKDWPRIAVEAGLSLNTIRNVVDHKRMPNMHTVLKLEAALKEKRGKK